MVNRINCQVDSGSDSDPKIGLPGKAGAEIRIICRSVPARDGIGIESEWDIYCGDKLAKFGLCWPTLIGTLSQMTMPEVRVWLHTLKPIDEAMKDYAKRKAAIENAIEFLEGS